MAIRAAPAVQAPPAQCGATRGGPPRPFEWQAPVQVPRAVTGLPADAFTFQVMPVAGALNTTLPW